MRAPSKPKPKRCWGAAADQHRARCRKDRPLCRWRRKVLAKALHGTAGPCRCDAYHYPHRPGAGNCTAGGGSGMPSILRQQLEQYVYDREKTRSRCPHCGSVHRDHSRCAPGGR